MIYELETICSHYYPLWMLLLGTSVMVKWGKANLKEHIFSYQHVFQQILAKFQSHCSLLYLCAIIAELLLILSNRLKLNACFNKKLFNFFNTK